MIARGARWTDFGQGLVLGAMAMVYLLGSGGQAMLLDYILSSQNPTGFRKTLRDYALMFELQAYLVTFFMWYSMVRFYSHAERMINVVLTVRVLTEPVHGSNRCCCCAWLLPL